MVAVLQMAQSCMCVMVGGQGSSPLGLSLPVRWQRLTGWLLGKGRGAVGEVYARPCARYFRASFHSLHSLLAGDPCTPPFRVRALRLRRVESFTLVAYST